MGVVRLESSNAEVENVARWVLGKHRRKQRRRLVDRHDQAAKKQHKRRGRGAEERIRRASGPAVALATALAQTLLFGEERLLNECKLSSSSAQGVFRILYDTKESRVLSICERGIHLGHREQNRTGDEAVASRLMGQAGSVCAHESWFAQLRDRPK